MSYSKSSVTTPEDINATSTRSYISSNFEPTCDCLVATGAAIFLICPKNSSGDFASATPCSLTYKSPCPAGVPELSLPYSEPLPGIPVVMNVPLLLPVLGFMARH